jgi:hypothetical protein
MTTGIRIGASLLAVVGIGMLSAPTASYAERQGEERRDDRREVRDARQDEREAVRDAKKDCLAGDEKSRAECRQEKRDTKQDARRGVND